MIGSRDQTAAPCRLLGVAVALWSLAAVGGGCKEAPKNAGPPEAGVPPLASSAPPIVEAPSAGAEPPTASATKPDAPRAVGGSTMKLLDAGQSPRRKLRYAWHLDQKEQLAMDLRTAASTGAPGTSEVPLPSVHIAVDIDPKSVTADGELRYAWRVISARTDARDDTPSDVTEGMRAEVAGIARLSGSALVTSRGLAREVTVDPNSSVDAVPGDQMAEQILQTLRDVAAPLPDEEVGVGARWRKLSQLDERDARVTQTETFRLVDLQGDRGTLDDTLAQTAPPQALRAPAASPGAHARMESMLASGEAKMRFDVSRLVSQTTFDGTTTMVLSGESRGDSARTMRMVMRVFIAISGSRR
jgi:hypothetical protein